MSQWRYLPEISLKKDAVTPYIIGHLAKQYGVSTSTIRRWADIDGFESKTMPEITNAKSLVMPEFCPTIRKKSWGGRSYGCAVLDAEDLNCLVVP